MRAGHSSWLCRALSHACLSPHTQSWALEDPARCKAGQKTVNETQGDGLLAALSNLNPAFPSPCCCPPLGDRENHALWGGGSAGLIPPRQPLEPSQAFPSSKLVFMQKNLRGHPWHAGINIQGRAGFCMPGRGW